MIILLLISTQLIISFTTANNSKTTIKWEVGSNFIMPI